MNTLVVKVHGGANFAVIGVSAGGQALNAAVCR